MGAPADIWREAAANFDRHVQAVADGQWEAPTPCEGWTVRDLVDHTVHWQATVGGIVGAGTSPGDDWATVRAAIDEALNDPASLEGDTDPSVMGGMPKHQILGIATGDVLIHSWDLARSIGADETLPREAVEAVQMGLSRFPEEMMRGSGMFGPAVAVPDDASPQDRLLGFVGRQP